MEFDWLDIGIVGTATYLALTLLVRLMLRRRDEVMAELSEQIAEEREKQRRARKKGQGGGGGTGKSESGGSANDGPGKSGPEAGTSHADTKRGRGAA